MADTTALKNRIRAAIKVNGNQEITGPVLQQALLDIVDELDLYPELQEAINTEKNARQQADTQLNNLITGIKNNIDNGYVYAGIATPLTTPVSGKVFYVAVQAGTYTNFGGTAVTEGITILKYNGASWVKEQALFTDGGVFDISAYHATGGTLATYDNLEDALGTNGANIPQSLRRGGMSIKYVQSSDNKYVQYRLTADEWSTNTEDWAIADEGVYVENPEFTEVKVDAEDRILEAILKDGTKLLPAGVKVVGTAEYDGATIKTVENPEFAGIWLDGEDKILFGIEQDGNFLFGCGIPNQIKEYIEQKIEELSLDEYGSIVNFIGDYLNNTTLEELLSKKVDGEYVENPEWVEMKTDSEDKILEGTTVKGTKVFGADVKVLGALDINGVSYKVVSNPEWLKVVVEAEDRIICGIKADGKFYVGDADFLDDIEAIKDNLNLSESGMTEFQQALKNHGFKPGVGGDFTDKSSMQIPMPRLAFVNITAPNGNAIWPTSKTNNYHYYMEFYDGAGNYFRKEIIFNAQGRSSMYFVKKNGAVDICNNNSWDDEDTFSIKFGNWVSQDSFHFKSYYNDFFRGIGVVGYKIYELILEKENIQSNKPWKKELLKAFAAGYDTSTYKGVDDMSIQMDNGARCFPDGFPAIFYLNGEFYGVYSWQLKKHRDNYHLNKDNGNHIHLDGNINWGTLFGANGDSSKINWNPDSWAGFEIRNPKKLYTTTGDEYNAELNKRQEIANEEIVNSWIESGQLPNGTTITNKIKKALNNSKDVYNSIVSLSTYCQTIIDMDKNNVSTDEIKNYFEEHFDVDNIIDYIIFSSITYNWDGFGSNWQWFTYDGVKWYVTPYDLDNIFGAFVQGNFIININPRIFGISNTITLPPSVIGKYYIPELKTKWDSVKNILNPNNTILLVKDWMDRIGQYYYKEEYKKWKNTPPNRDSNVNSEFWVFTNEFVSSSADTGNYTYDEEKNYHAFDGNERADNTCWFSSQSFKYKFRCVKANIGQKPVLDEDRYRDSEEILGFHDSIWRIYATMNHIYSGLNNIINNL